jgi:hypothetical protein
MTASFFTTQANDNLPSTGLLAFHRACDQRQLGLAEEIFDRQMAMSRQGPKPRGFGLLPRIIALQCAFERLQCLRREGVKLVRQPKLSIVPKAERRGEPPLTIRLGEPPTESGEAGVPPSLGSGLGTGVCGIVIAVYDVL